MFVNSIPSLVTQFGQWNYHSSQQFHSWILIFTWFLPCFAGGNLGLSQCPWGLGVHPWCRWWGGGLALVQRCQAEVRAPDEQLAGGHCHCCSAQRRDWVWFWGRESCKYINLIGSDWWFGTWLLVFHILGIYNHPNCLSLIFFRGVGVPPTSK